MAFSEPVSFGAAAAVATSRLAAKKRATKNETRRENLIPSAQNAVRYLRTKPSELSWASMLYRPALSNSSGSYPTLKEVDSCSLLQTTCFRFHQLTHVVVFPHKT